MFFIRGAMAAARLSLSNAYHFASFVRCILLCVCLNTHSLVCSRFPLSPVSLPFNQKFFFSRINHQILFYHSVVPINRTRGRLRWLISLRLSSLSLLFWLFSSSSSSFISLVYLLIHLLVHLLIIFRSSLIHLPIHLYLLVHLLIIFRSSLIHLLIHL